MIAILGITPFIKLPKTTAWFKKMYIFSQIKQLEYFALISFTNFLKIFYKIKN